MALNQQSDEQSNWNSRAEKERQHLSASVEETLADTDIFGQQEDESDRPRTATSGTPLVPPRLSLQSRSLPAVEASGLVNATTSEHPLIARDDTREEEHAQRGSMLSRLARRFTAPFTAIGGSSKATLGNKQAGQGTQLSQETHQPPIIGHTETFPGGERLDEPLVRVLDTTPPINALPAALPQSQTGSLKRNAKVRLETAVLPAVSPPTTKKIEEQETGQELRSAEVRDALDEQQVVLTHTEEERPSPSLAIQKTSEDERVLAAQDSLSGTGSFESGQGDVTIANKHITPSSVVHITLTSNPGPVVVQYISLLPQTSFTVHLTAPAATHVTFNYIILATNVL